jgi:hypothetical protein
MARVVDQSLFLNGKRGRPAKYPWDEWLNGQVWALKFGEDIPEKDKLTNFRLLGRHHASRRKLKLATQVSLDGQELLIQARPV